MYKLNVTLNEPNEEKLIVRQYDSPLLKLTVFNHDGTAWPAGYDAILRVGRVNRDLTIWEIAGLIGDDDNEWYFQLEAVTWVLGDYDMILYLNHPADATPEAATPIYEATPVEDIYGYELDYSFLPIILEVR